MVEERKKNRFHFIKSFNLTSLLRREREREIENVYSNAQRVEYMENGKAPS